MRSSTATRELTADLRGTGQSMPKLSSNAALAINLRTSENAKLTVYSFAKRLYFMASEDALPSFLPYFFWAPRTSLVPIY